jgi:23S rRNA pseudouridine1911/1915/1917 synthase
MRHEVDADQAGRRIGQVLSSIPGIHSRSQAERLLDGGGVRVNGDIVIKSARLRSGDIVEVEDELLAPPPKVTYADLDLPVLYQDDHVLVIDKPAGLVVHPARGHKGTTLVEQLMAQGVQLASNVDAEIQRPGVVHRLDKDTSGAIALAKTLPALTTLQDAIRARTMRREYLALVAGHVPSRAGRIEAPIGRDRRDPTKQSIDTDSPKDATTHFVVIEVLPTTTMLRLRLETGRTHQIRVHLQAIGHPVTADPQYGVAGEYDLHRQFLHAAQLRFPHPVTGEAIEVTSPLPEELLAALAEARRAS